MTSSKEYLGFVLEQMSDIRDITFRSMMRECLLYQKGRLFGGVYDNHLLVKLTEVTRALCWRCKQRDNRGGSLFRSEEDVSR